MNQHHNKNLSAYWIPPILSILICISLSAATTPITLESPWLLEDEQCVSTGDVPVCEVTFASGEMSAQGSLHLIADQDSPLFGETSRGEKQLQFKRTFSAESSIRVKLFAELVGSLRIEGGSGEIVVRASVSILDANTHQPVAGMEINASTFPDAFTQIISGPGVVDIQDLGSQTTTLAAGTYIIVGIIAAIAEITPGWQNHQAEADVSLAVGFLPESDESNIPQAVPTPADEPDYIVIPLGVEGTRYEHLEPGVRGGTFYASSLLDPMGWNAVTARDSTTTRYTNIMMRGLLSIDPTTAVLIPELSRSWDISEDGLEIALHLRRGLQWSDGEPFTADDVLFTFNDLYFNPDVDTDTR
ncbi:hypothetical protein KAH43_04965, partial [Candidatus Bipolaricaulota bacterium]|nr:hypothetical protein [Candidatus Bipolaricaulota bacterium]